MDVHRTFVLVAALSALALGCDKGGEKSGEKGSSESAAEKPAAPAGPVALTDEKLGELAALQIPGFTGGMAGKPMMGQLTLNFTGEEKNPNGVSSRIMLQIGRCMGSNCRAMDKATWESEKDRTFERMMMPKAHVDNEKKEWTFEEAQVAGKKVVLVRTFSYVESTDDKGGTTRASMNGLSLNYNNGKNHVRIGVSGAGNFPQNEEEARTKYTKEEMLAAATKVFEAVQKHLE